MNMSCIMMHYNLLLAKIIMENVWFWNIMYLMLLHMFMICYSIQKLCYY